jgi:4-hydroxy-3-polyprenylbenzoate decarboxylase
LLYEAASLGAIIAPPMPAFYSQPQTIDDLINHSVGRVLDLFDVDAGILQRWTGTTGPEALTSSKLSRREKEESTDTMERE